MGVSQGASQGASQGVSSACKLHYTTPHARLWRHFVRLVTDEFPDWLQLQLVGRSVGWLVGWLVASYGTSLALRATGGTRRRPGRSPPGRNRGIETFGGEWESARIHQNRHANYTHVCIGTPRLAGYLPCRPLLIPHTEGGVEDITTAEACGRSQHRVEALRIRGSDDQRVRERQQCRQIISRFVRIFIYSRCNLHYYPFVGR
jgi:hypothetical protein